MSPPRLLTRASLLACLAPTIACGPSVQAPESEVGDLGYSNIYTHIYRSGALFEVAPGPEFGPVENDSDSGVFGCGKLTDDALEDIEGAIDQLDEDFDYSVRSGDPLCVESTPEENWIHVPGFAHSPFECEPRCCHPALRPILATYGHVIENMAGRVVELDGEEFLVVDSRHPCE